MRWLVGEIFVVLFKCGLEGLCSILAEGSSVSFGLSIKPSQKCKSSFCIRMKHEEQREQAREVGEPTGLPLCVWYVVWDPGASWHLHLVEPEKKVVQNSFYRWWIQISEVLGCFYLVWRSEDRRKIQEETGWELGEGSCWEAIKENIEEAFSHCVLPFIWFSCVVLLFHHKSLWELDFLIKIIRECPLNWAWWLW